MSILKNLIKQLSIKQLRTAASVALITPGFAAGNSSKQEAKNLPKQDVIKIDDAWYGNQVQPVESLIIFPASTSYSITTYGKGSITVRMQIEYIIHEVRKKKEDAKKEEISREYIIKLIDDKKIRLDEAKREIIVGGASVDIPNYIQFKPKK